MALISMRTSEGHYVMRELHRGLKNSQYFFVRDIEGRMCHVSRYAVKVLKEGDLFEYYVPIEDVERSRGLGDVYKSQAFLDANLKGAIR